MNDNVGNITTGGHCMTFANRVIILLIVTAIQSQFFCTAYAKTLAYWNFDRTFLDMSGNGHDLRVAGNVFFNEDNPFKDKHKDKELDNCIIIQPDSHVSAADNFIGPGRNFTFELFFKTDAGRSGVLASTYSPPAVGVSSITGGWLMMLHADGRVSVSVFLFDFETRVELYSATGYNDGNWHHCAFTISESNYLKAYIDGEQFGEAFTYGISFARNPITIGGFYNDNTTSFSGSIDEVRLSEGVLDADNLLVETVSRIAEPWTLVLLAMTILLIVSRMIASEGCV